MNEKEAMEYIAYLNTLGSKPGLTVIRELLRRAGDPQKELAFIHIAGTNGKGSVSAFLSNILMAAGYRVGRYNSPTIRTYRERICVNKSMISKTALCRLLTQLKTCCDEMVADGFAHPTSFEVETVLGFLYYKEKNGEYTIMDILNSIDATYLDYVSTWGDGNGKKKSVNQKVELSLQEAYKIVRPLYLFIE